MNTPTNQLATRTDLAPTAEVIDEPPQVWIVGRGEWSDTEPIAAVQGTEADARRVAEQLAPKYPGYPIVVWCEVPFYPAPMHG